MTQAGFLSLRGWPSTAGTNSRNAKLNPERVREIRAANDAKLDKHFAAKFGVSPDCVSKVRRYMRWANLEATQ